MKNFSRNYALIENKVILYITENIKIVSKREINLNKSQ